jgi:hypothetical protein
MRVVVQQWIVVVWIGEEKRLLVDVNDVDELNYEYYQNYFDLDV